MDIFTIQSKIEKLENQISQAASINTQIFKDRVEYTPDKKIVVHKLLNNIESEYKMLNSHIQKHLVKIKVYVKKLCLKVRFPCSVSFQLKHQFNQSQSKNTYPLLDNSINIDESFELELQTNYNNVLNRYQSKKMQLSVFMTSSSGKVVAGSVRFDAFERSEGLSKEYAMGLQKCPDKDAKIYFSQSYEYLSNSKQLQKSSFSYIEELKHLSPRTNFTRNLADSPSKTAIQQRKNHDDKLTNDSKQISWMNKNDLRSYVTFSQGFSNNLQVVNNQRVSQLQNNTLYKDKQNDNSQNKNNDLNKNQNIQQRKVQRLRTQNNYGNRQEFTVNDNRIKKWQLEIQDLSNELQRGRQKMRDYEKKEKNWELMIKQLKQETDNKKQKQLLFNTRIQQLQTLLNIKEKQIMNFIWQKKHLEEQFQEQQLKMRTEERRKQIKISNLEEQLLKIQNKYKEAQKQRAKVTNDYNKLLNQLEDNEKKQQGNIKEKQKVATQEKIKLNKKIDQLTEKINIINTQAKQQVQTIQLLQKDKKTLSKEIKEKNIQLMSLQTQKHQIKLKLGKEFQQIQRYQKELQNFKNIENQRNIIKKLNIQLQHEIESLKEKQNTTEKSLQNLQDKCKTLQQKLTQINNQKTTLLGNDLTLKRDIEKHQTQIKKLIKQNKNFQKDILQLNKINTDLKTKLQTIQIKTEVVKTQYDSQITQTIKQKNNLENQLDEYKWLLQKYKQNGDIITQRHYQVNYDILSLNEQLVEKTEKIKKLQEGINELKLINQTLKSQKHTIEKKLKQLTSTLKQHQDQLYQIKINNQQLEQQTNQYIYKLNHLQNNYKQKSEKQNKIHKQKEGIIDVKLSQLEKAQLKIKEMNEQLGNSEQQSTVFKREIEHWKLIYHQLNQQKRNLEEKMLLGKQEKKLLQEKFMQVQSMLRQSNKIVQKLQRNLQKSSQEFQNYKSTITQSLENLLFELSKDEQSNTGTVTSISLKGLVDGHISKLQVEIIQKRNTMILNFKARIFQLEESLEITQIENRKLQIVLENIQREKQFLIEKQKETLKKCENRIKNQEEHCVTQIKVMQESNKDKISQIQKLSIQNNNQLKVIEQQNQQIGILLCQYGSLKQDNDAFSVQFHNFHTQQLKQQKISESKFNELSIHFQDIISRLRQDILLKQEKIVESEKIIKDKSDALKKMQKSIQSQRFQKERLLQLYLQTRQKYVNLELIRQELFRRLKQEQKKSNKLLIQVNDLVNKLESEKIRIDDIDMKNQRLEEDLMEIQVEKQRLKKQLDNCKQKNMQLQSVMKEKGQSDKLSLSKYLDEIEKLKEKLIQARSEVEFKSYRLKQNQQTIKNLKKQIETLQSNLSKHKSQIEERYIQLKEYKSSNLSLQQKLTRMQNQKNNIQKEIYTKTSYNSQKTHPF